MEIFIGVAIVEVGIPDGHFLVDFEYDGPFSEISFSKPGFFFHIVYIMVVDESNVGTIYFVFPNPISLCSKIHVNSWTCVIDDDFETFTGENEGAILTND
jgi:hypothetical protein